MENSLKYTDMTAICDKLNHQFPEGAIVTTPFGCTGILKNFSTKSDLDGINVNVYIGFNVADEVACSATYGYYPEVDKGEPRFATLAEIVKLYSLITEKRIDLASAIQIDGFLNEFKTSPICDMFEKLTLSQRDTVLTTLKSSYSC